MGPKKPKIKKLEKRKTYKASVFVEMKYLTAFGKKSVVRKPIYHKNSHNFTLNFVQNGLSISHVGIHPKDIFIFDDREDTKELFGDFGKSLFSQNTYFEYNKDDIIDNPEKFFIILDKIIKSSKYYVDFEDFNYTSWFISEPKYLRSNDYNSSNPFTDEELYDVFIKRGHENEMMYWYSKMFTTIYSKEREITTVKNFEVFEKLFYEVVGNDLSVDNKIKDLRYFMINDFRMCSAEKRTKKEVEEQFENLKNRQTILKTMFKKYDLDKLVVYTDANSKSGELYYKELIRNTYQKPSSRKSKFMSEYFEMAFNIDEHLIAMNTLDLNLENMSTYLMSQMTEYTKKIHLFYNDAFYMSCEAGLEKTKTYNNIEYDIEKTGDYRMYSQGYKTDKENIEIFENQDVKTFASKCGRVPNNPIIKSLMTALKSYTHNDEVSAFDYVFKFPIYKGKMPGTLDDIYHLVENYKGDYDILLEHLYEKLITDEFYNFKTAKNPLNRLVENLKIINLNLKM